METYPPQVTPNLETVDADKLTRQIESVRRQLAEQIATALGGEENGAHYEEYPADQAIRQVKVERNGGERQDGWLVIGEGTNDSGAVAYAVGRFENDDFIGKAVTKEMLEAWNQPEKAETAPKVSTDMGHTAMQASGVERPMVEAVDAPVEQLDLESPASDKPSERFAYLLNPDYDDGLTDAERVQAAAVDTRTPDEIAADELAQARRTADHKDSLAKQTERMRSGGN